jgi:hypothetical protein
LISLGIPLAGLDGAQGFWDEYLKEVIHNQKKRKVGSLNYLANKKSNAYKRYCFF